MYGNIKITILGNSSTGKSSIVHRFSTDEFNTNNESTIGASFLTKVMDDIKYDIWDTAGQERYLSLAPMYYRGSDILLLVFNFDNLETLDRLDYYLKKISEEVWNKEYRLIIIGNKLDLIHDNNKEKIINETNKYLDNKFPEHEFKYGRECIHISAKSGENFDILKDKINEFGKILVLKKPQITREKNIQLDEKKTNTKYLCNC